MRQQVEDLTDSIIGNTYAVIFLAHISVVKNVYSYNVYYYTSS